MRVFRDAVGARGAPLPGALPAFGLSLLVLLLVPGTLRAQPADAARVVRTALERHGERARGIVAYTQRVRIRGMDDDTLTFEFQRDTAAGVPVFVPEGPSLASVLGARSPAGASRNPWEFLGRYGDRMAYRGTARVDGHGVHVLTLDDFTGTGLDEGASLSPLLDRFTFEEMRFSLDRQTFVPRLVEAVGTAVWRGTPRKIRYRVRYAHYRPVDGWLHPFLLEGSVEIQFTEEERRGLDGRLETLRRRLEGAPPERRETLRAAVERLSEIASGSLRFGAETVGLEIRRR